MIKNLFIPLLAAACVSAHGFLADVTINGKSYAGNRPRGNNGPSIIQQVSTQDPNYGASNPALTCGPDATSASLVADANPGDTFTFDWRTASLGNWPHNTGPMLTYLASCGSQTCDDFDAGSAKWFKIQQVGRKSPGGPWAQQDISAYTAYSGLGSPAHNPLKILQ
ncbi:hypothetical protein NLJ89_g10554 [Agrocybe chaxingu]|uniref:lytic cellulose monooxygenase (C4-dehydrogenating) n=1 Tax=Agrocybe chaxingu TaxID=84603 RepID=A0A9W8MQT3_9AGAR|nr:hypothetical protein NLJ89_g10554 [Agrocybe chaxingu]